MKLKKSGQLFMLAVGLTSTFSLAQASKGGSSGGGGAGCPQSDGSVITLLECGARQTPISNPSFAPPAPPQAIDAPSETPDGLADLRNYVKNYPYLTEAQKTVILGAAEPTFYRKYFYVDNAPGLTQTILDRIKAEFQAATGLEPSQLILYGVTDTNARMSNSDQPVQVTYLLPAFRQLKTMEEKMTALFHENYWVMHPSATYLEVVNAEMAFEAAMQKPDDTQKQIDFVRNFTSVSPELQKLYLKKDLETGALNGFLSEQNQLTNIQLYGADVLNCYEQLEKNRDKKAQDTCDTQFLDRRDMILRTYPNSLFVAQIRNIARTNYSQDSFLLQTFNALYGERVLANSLSGPRGINQPIFPRLFDWQARNNGVVFQWMFKGPSGKAVTLTLTTDVNAKGPFVTDQPFATPSDID